MNYIGNKVLFKRITYEGFIYIEISALTQVLVLYVNRKL